MDKRGSRCLNYYAILGAPKDATQEALRQRVKVITRAYRRLWGLAPPSGAGAAHQRELTEAIDVLRHPGRRREYDARLPDRPAYYPRRGEPKLYEEAGCRGVAASGAGAVTRLEARCLTRG